MGGIGWILMSDDPDHRTKFGNWATRQTVYNIITEKNEVMNVTLTRADEAFLKRNHIKIVTDGPSWVPHFIELNTPKEHALLALRVKIFKGNNLNGSRKENWNK